MGRKTFFNQRDKNWVKDFVQMGYNLTEILKGTQITEWNLRKILEELKEEGVIVESYDTLRELERKGDFSKMVMQEKRGRKKILIK